MGNSQGMHQDLQRSLSMLAFSYQNKMVAVQAFENLLYPKFLLILAKQSGQLIFDITIV
jgi:hypothetical protein